MTLESGQNVQRAAVLVVVQEGSCVVNNTQETSLPLFLTSVVEVLFVPRLTKHAKFRIAPDGRSTKPGARYSILDFNVNKALERYLKGPEQNVNISL